MGGDTLTYRTKNYRLSSETRALLEAICRVRPRTYLTFDELFNDLADRMLRRDRILEADVERYLRAHGFAELADRRENARKTRISENRRLRGLPGAEDAPSDS